MVYSKLTYIKTPVKPRKQPLPVVAKTTNNIRQLPTWRILGHLYQRHETTLLYAALFATWAWLLVG